MEFKDKLTELRKSKGLSQEDLGNQIGVSRQTISKWESGQSYPDFQRLVLLSEYFDISLDVLIRDPDSQDIGNRNGSDSKADLFYDDVQKAKSAFHSILNAFAVFGLVGVVFFLLLGIIFR